MTRSRFGHDLGVHSRRTSSPLQTEVSTRARRAKRRAKTAEETAVPAEETAPIVIVPPPQAPLLAETTPRPVPRRDSVGSDDSGTDARPAVAEGVRVIARFRPQNELEIAEGGDVCVDVALDGKDVSVVDELGRDYAFNFSRVFPEFATQDDVYQDVGRPIVRDVLGGLNACILAYGQTGSGKSHTMFGPDRCEDPNERGIIPKLMGELFATIDYEDNMNEDYSLHASFIEIYNESIRDLFAPSAVSLRVRQDPSNSLWIPDATQVPVNSAAQVLELLTEGTRNRRKAETRQNRDSSRSHAVFVVAVRKRNLVTVSSTMSMLYLVDLAGSEKLSKTNVEGEQLNEAKYINKSLLSLGQVIEALSKRKPPAHIPYRNSQLTRILQNAFGGNSRTVLVVNASSSSYNDRETISSLRFGARATKIRNKPTVNRGRTVEELQQLLRQSKLEVRKLQEHAYNLQREVDQLRSRSRRSSGGGSGEAADGSDAARARPATAAASPTRACTTCKSLESQVALLHDSLGQRVREIDNMKATSGVPPVFFCPITRKLFTDPVVAADGYTYERAAIELWFDNDRKHSPLTGRTLAHLSLVPNRGIEAAMAADETVARRRKLDADGSAPPLASVPLKDTAS